MVTVFVFSLVHKGTSYAVKFHLFAATKNDMIYGAFIANKSSLINIKMLKIKLKLRISSISFNL